jgi:hypothetical protein
VLVSAILASKDSRTGIVDDMAAGDDELIPVGMGGEGRSEARPAASNNPRPTCSSATR